VRTQFDSSTVQRVASSAIATSRPENTQQRPQNLSFASTLGTVSAGYPARDPSTAGDDQQPWQTSADDRRESESTLVKSRRDASRTDVTAKSDHELRSRTEHSLASADAGAKLKTQTRSDEEQNTPTSPDVAAVVVPPPVQAQAPSQDRPEARGDGEAKPARASDSNQTAANSAQSPAKNATSESGGDLGHESSGEQHAPRAAATLRGVAGSTTANYVSSVPSATTTSQPGGASDTAGRPIDSIHVRETPRTSNAAKAMLAKLTSARPTQGAPEAESVWKAGKALAAALKSGGDLKLELSPEQLGKMRVEMSQTDSGVQVNITCELGRTAQMLRDGAVSLRSQLEEQGVTVAGVNVTAAPGTDPIHAAASQVHGATSQASSDSAGSATDSGAGHEHAPSRAIHAPHGVVAADGDGRDDSGDAEIMIGVSSQLGTRLAELGADGRIVGIDAVA